MTDEQNEGAADATRLEAIARAGAHVEALTHKVGVLAGLRNQKFLAEEQVELLRQEVEATPQWADFVEGQQKASDISDAIQSVDDDLRETAMDVAAEIGDRKPIIGVEVIERTRFQILDYGEALEYAKAEMVAALKLDERVFKKLVLALPESGRPESVFVTKDPAVRIAGDLTAYLEGDPNEPKETNE